MMALRDIRRRIHGIRRISRITGATKTVAMIRLMKLQGQVNRHASYAARLREMGEGVLAAYRQSSAPHEGEAIVDAAPIACLVLGSDRGLCGAFNANLLAEVEQFLSTRGRDRVRLIVAGRKLAHLLAGRGLSAAADISAILREFSIAKASQLSDDLRKEFLEGRVGQLWAVHTKFSSSTRQRALTTRLLPFVADEDEGPDRDADSGYLFEPGRPAVAAALSDEQYVHGIIQVFLESMASEQMARMLAMDMATTNAEEMVHDLTRQLNKVRQEMINNELAEISSATEVLRNA
jgi:F-type H+-transporting ATPase subunit gamma